MRYIDRTGKRMNERGESREIKTMGAMTREATKKAEENGLGVMKTSWGAYKVIRACGLGAYQDAMKDLAEVDRFLKRI